MVHARHVTAGDEGSGPALRYTPAAPPARAVHVAVRAGGPRRHEGALPVPQRRRKASKLP